MKYLKIIGLAALAAMALTAVVASSASAATVCSTAGTGASCGGSHGNIYAGKVVAKNSGNVVLTVTSGSGSTINTVTCTGSEAGGEITDGEKGTGLITTLDFTGCTSNICGAVTASTTASAATPWSASVATEGATVNTNGTMTVLKPTGVFSCTFLGVKVTCAYTTASAAVKVTGSDTAPKITATNVQLERESGSESVCGVKADWNGTYSITTPSSIFIL
jgi:hypothetical protein